MGRNSFTSLGTPRFRTGLQTYNPYGAGKDITPYVTGKDITPYVTGKDKRSYVTGKGKRSYVVDKDKHPYVDGINIYMLRSGSVFLYSPFS